MLDIFKDGAEAWLQRIKSPLIGSFVLSFIAFNWKVIFFVVFSDTPILFRFWYFDTETSICTLLVYPAGTGLLIGLGTPYLNYFGSWVAKQPTERLRVLTANSASVVMTAKAKFATERLLISAEFKEAALRDAKADQEIEDAELDSDTKSELKDTLAENFDGSAATNKDLDVDSVSRLPASAIFEDLNESQVTVVKILGPLDKARTIADLASDNDVRSSFLKVLPRCTEARAIEELKSTVTELEKLDLAHKNGNYQWKLSQKGYAVLDLILDSEK